MRIELSEEHAGRRLDKILVEVVEGVGRAAAKRYFSEGRVRVLDAEHAQLEGARGRVAQKGDAAVAGDILLVELSSVERDGIAPDESIELDIVHEDDHVVVINKPAGIPCAPLRMDEQGTVANALLARYPEMAHVGFARREPGLCHRLDNDTSGLLIAARNVPAFDEIVSAIRAGEVDKRYMVLCPADALSDTGSIELPIAPHPKDRRRSLACVHPRDVARYQPRPASTTYRILRHVGDIALCEASAPKALRHQIRAHFAAIGAPLLGDTLYGGAPWPNKDEGAERHALHASAIRYAGGEIVAALELECPLPADLEALVSSS